MSQTPVDMLARVRLMADGNSCTWDLSDNDVEALRFVWAKMERAEARVKVLEGALDGFLTKGSSLGVSHPHLSSYISFPKEVWDAAIAARALGGEK